MPLRPPPRPALLLAVAMAQSPQGQQARQALQQLLPVGSTVTLQAQAKDLYGRTIVVVFTPSGANAGLCLIQQGNAFAYRQHLKQCDEWAYLDREKFAERYRLVLWRAPGGIERPWPFWVARRGGQIRRAVVLQDYGVLGASSAATERLWMAMGMERACEALS